MTALPVLLIAAWLLPPQAVGPAFQNTDFKRIDRLDALPVHLRQALAEATHGTRMANPGESFEATDVIIDESTPRRRLIFAGVSLKMSFVYYEHGGYGLHEHLLIFVGDEKAGYRLVDNLFMSHGIESRPGNIGELKSFITRRKLLAAMKGDA